MPRYFFDFDDTSDDLGLMLADDEDAWREARRALPGVILDAVSRAANGKTRRHAEYYCEIRNERGKTLGRLSAFIRETRVPRLAYGPRTRKTHHIAASSNLSLTRH